MNQDAQEELRFEKIKEKRKGYFVAYQPYNKGSELTLNFIGQIPPLEDIKKLMLDELRKFIKRYPIDTTVSAYDDKGFIDIFLYGWIDRKNCKFEYTWNLEDEGIRSDSLKNSIPKTNEELIKIFEGIPSHPASQDHEKIIKRMKSLRSGRNIAICLLFLWICCIPLVLGLLQFFGPKYLGGIALAYCFCKCIYKYIEIFHPNLLKKDQVDSEIIDLEYYYDQCKRNPEGFTKLVSENIEKERKEKQQKEYDQLNS